MQRNPQLPPVGRNPDDPAPPVNPYIMPVTEPGVGGAWRARQQRLNAWKAANPARLRNSSNGPNAPSAPYGAMFSAPRQEFGAFNAAIPTSITPRPLGG